MLLYSISFLLTSITAATLGIFVYLKNRRSPINRSWLLLSLSTSVYTFFYQLHISAQVKDMAILWGKLLCIGSIAASPAFLLFSLHFTNRYDKAKKFVPASLFVATIFMLMIPTNLMFKDAGPMGIYAFYAIPGPVYGIYLVYFAFNVIVGHYYLFSTLRSATGPERVKIQYMLLATCIAFFAASSTFFPLYEIDYLGAFSLLLPLYPLIISTAIVRHQLMDIDVIIRRTVVFAGLFASVYGILTLLTFTGQHLFEKVLGWNSLLATIPTVLIIIVTVRPLETFLINVTQRFLFQRKYDYKELLKVFTSEVLSLTNLQILAEKTVEGLNNIIKLESCSVFLLDNTNAYNLRAGLGVSSKLTTIQKSDLLIRHLHESAGYISIESLNTQRAEEKTIHEQLKALNAILCLPIMFRDKLLGFISFGMKKSGEIYDEGDIEVLMSLARTEAIAISNARLFDELARTQAEAAQREKMAVIGTLAAGINHEICNPLGIARGQSEMFLLNYRDGIYKDKTDKELVQIASTILEKVMKEIDRATGITKRLSTFAKPSKKFEMVEVNLKREIEEVLTMLTQELKLDNIETRLEIPDNLPAIFADRQQIQQVVFNLARNAGQAIAENGKIVLRARKNNDRVELDIEDTGSGMPPEILNSIFNPFFTTKEPGKGTGLGLFIVKQIIERNNGTIHVESTVGKGTKFTLTFQAVKPATIA